ncbi:MAG: hypothetical protein ABIO39_02025 [Caulobacteraceae bacterium]
MAGRTRVLTVRLHRGGILLIAPANILPWPRVLNPTSKPLQIEALRRALGDASAMQQFRREFNQLMNIPVARSTALMTDQQLIAEYMRAARRGLLTVVFGHVESTTSDRAVGATLNVVFEGHPVIAALARKFNRSTLDPRADLPLTGTPLPASYHERLAYVVSRSRRYLSDDALIRLREFFSKSGLATTVAILSLWSAGHVVGVGFVIDAALFASIVWQLGSGALLVFEQLKVFFDLTRHPSGWHELDKASQKYAAAVNSLGPSLLRQLLRRIGKSTGTQGGTALEATAEARIGTPAKKPASGEFSGTPGSPGAPAPDLA